jgi:hypothetical protein
MCMAHTRMRAVFRAGERARILLIAFSGPGPDSGHEQEPSVPLLVAVAELATHGIHQISEDLVLAGETKGKAVGEFPFTAGWAVVQSFRSLDSVLAVFRIERLPDSPDAVDHGMVEEEDRVVGRRVEILHLRGTTTEPVAGAVDTELVVADETLHLGLEVLDVGLTEKKLGHVLYRD